MHRGFQAGRIVVVENIAVAFVIRAVRVVRVEDRVRQAAGVAHDGDGAVFEADHLGQAARFVGAGHENHVRAGVDEMGQVFGAILSGRKSSAVAKRARELGIKLVRQGIARKREEFARMLKRLRLEPAAAGYMGDDLVDVPVLRRCGFACAPREAPEQVRKSVHYVCSAPAGGGAVRELCEFIMRAQGTFDRQLQEYLA